MWRISWGKLTWAQHRRWLFLHKHGLWKFDVYWDFKSVWISRPALKPHGSWDKMCILFWFDKNPTIYHLVLWVPEVSRLTVGLPLLAQHLDVHRRINAAENFSPFLSSIFVAGVDGSGLPVCPVERLFMKSEGEWVSEGTLHNGLPVSINTYM